MKPPFPREDFPLFQKYQDLAFLDNAATTQKPSVVIEAIQKFYSVYNANIHRGVYGLAQEATYQVHEARKKIAQFIRAHPEEIIFVRNTTEGLNLFIRTYAEQYLKPKDRLLATLLDHHAVLVPLWQVAKREGLSLHLCPLTRDGFIDENAFSDLLEKSPRLVVFPHVSNVLGTVQPVKKLTRWAHEKGAVVLLDAAQSAPHIPLDVQSLGVDGAAFSAHKMLGPTGIGVLWIRKEILETLPPFLGGGDMIDAVHWDSKEGKIHPSWNALPWRFEAGTQHMAGAVGFGKAVDYLMEKNLSIVEEYERTLLNYVEENLQKMPKVQCILPPQTKNRIGVIPFLVEGYSPEEVALFLDQYGVACRSGYHCAQPLHEFFNLQGTVRMSFYGYTTYDEVDQCLKALRML